MKGMLVLHANERFRELGWRYVCSCLRAVNSIMRIVQMTQIMLVIRLLLQIHDELICEGPEESHEVCCCRCWCLNGDCMYVSFHLGCISLCSQEAMQIVKHCMANPFTRPLQVELVVDAKCADTWYEAK